MRTLASSLLLCGLATVASAATAGGPATQGRSLEARASDVELQINTKDKSARNETSKDLYGIMFEDINHSGDGGIYAELIVNRAFQGSNIVTGSVPNIDGGLIINSENKAVPYGPVITGWGAIGNARISLDTLHPLSDALQTVLQVDIPKDAKGEVGIINYGWWGMDVRPQTYKASFYVVANTARYTSNSTNFKVSIRSNLTGEVWAETKIPSVKVDTVDYIQVSADIVNKVKAPNSNNSFAITMDAAEVAGHTFYFDLVSLFPETFKNRKNGLRKDIADAYYSMKPRFLRFPGGNNMEGVSKFRRWKWWETIGPLKDRPGRQGNWDYFNTDGLGLLEYLEWCEDMEIEPIIGVYAGYSLDIYGLQGTSYPESRMGEVLQEALDELEYCMGDTSTKWGAKRAEHGHPAPFKVNYVEVGNEDWFSLTYPYRWPVMYNGLKKAYPHLTVISSTFNENAAYNISLPAGTIWDTHHYEQPKYFLDRFNTYDNWQAETNNTGVGVFLGEYSVFEVDSPSGSVNWSDTRGPNHMFYPTMLSAVAEGVYALGGERNPNTVKLSSYAPTLANLNWWNWVPNMITFTANHDELMLSASYWQQWMFGNYRGTQTLPVKNTKGDFKPLYWASSINGPSNAVYLKVINAGDASVPLTVKLDASYKSVNGTILKADDLKTYNFIGRLDVVKPRPLDISAAAGKNATDGFEWSVPGHSVTVLQFDL